MFNAILLNDLSNEKSKFATKYGIVQQSKSTQFETESIKSSLCHYSVEFILVTGDITVNTGTANGNDTHVAFYTVHHFLHVRQILMMFFLMKQTKFLLQSLCAI